AGVVAGVLACWLLSTRPARMAATAATVDRIAAERALAAAEVRGERAILMADEIDRLRTALADAHAELAGLEGTLEAERRAHAARLEDIARAEARLSDRFEALAGETLGSNAARFLDMVSERHAAHAAAEQNAIARLVDPLAETLARFENRLCEVESAREGAYAALTTQMNALAEGSAGLRSETARLVQALRAPKTRGRWGEMQLARVLEHCGLTEHVDWVAEQSLPGDDGLQRPDVIVRLPGERALVIDAKTPLDAFLALVEATGPEERRDSERRHARQMRAQMQALSAKAYWRRLETTPDFVIMFVPGDGICSAAMDSDPTLMEDAFRKRVLIATPATLVAMLRSIAHAWQQARIEGGAREILSAARALYDRLGVLGAHVDDLGRALGQAVERHNRVVASFDARVMPAARRIEALGAAPGDDAIPEPTAVDTMPRSIAAPESAGAPPPDTVARTGA
ncbi:MAG: DNA recombination protein RmuC, partial [Pseudomonadota bacterium]